MFLELLLFTLAGCILGIFTGLTPGIHVNTLGIIMLGLAGSINQFFIAALIISMAITHTIFDFIPSIFLGAPDPDTALSVLPGHRLLLEGRGLEAVYLTAVGGLGAMAAALLVFPVLLLSLPAAYYASRPYIHILLAMIAGVMILTEKSMKKKAAGFSCFLLSGILGLMLLDSYFLPTGLLLFPIFTGLFGISSLLISMEGITRIPKQDISNPDIPRKAAAAGILKGLFSGSIVGTLPGIGAAEATVLTQEITRRRDEKEFLISIGAINTIVALFSMIALYTISKPRSGAAVFIDKIIGAFGFNELIFLLGVSLVSTGISVLLILRIAKAMAFHMQKINYKKTTAVVIGCLIALTIILTGLNGLLILLVATSIGVLPPLLGVKRSSLMGVLMLPLILFYSGMLL